MAISRLAGDNANTLFGIGRNEIQADLDERTAPEPGGSVLAFLDRSSRGEL